MTPIVDIANRGCRSGRERVRLDLVVRQKADAIDRPARRTGAARLRCPRAAGRQSYRAAARTAERSHSTIPPTRASARRARCPAAWSRIRRWRPRRPEPGAHRPGRLISVLSTRTTRCDRRRRTRASARQGHRGPRTTREHRRQRDAFRGEPRATDCRGDRQRWPACERTASRSSRRASPISRRRLLWILLQTASHDAHDRSAAPRLGQRVPIRFTLDDSRHRLGDVVAGERTRCRPASRTTRSRTPTRRRACRRLCRAPARDSCRRRCP